MRRAYSLSANFSSVGKVYWFSQSRSCAPYAAIIGVCGKWTWVSMKPAEISASLPKSRIGVPDGNSPQHAARRSDMRDAPVGHGDDGIGLVDHRLVEAVAERIAGEGENRAANGGRAESKRQASRPTFAPNAAGEKPSSALRR